MMTKAVIGACTTPAQIAGHAKQGREMDVPGRVKVLSAKLRSSLSGVASHPAVGNVRVIGLMAGIELTGHSNEPGWHGRAVGAEVERRCVLFGVIGDTLAISPPLIVEETDILTHDQCALRQHRRRRGAESSLNTSSRLVSRGNDYRIGEQQK
jgi:acetylornithine/succinyldiaminopimelate/putrescine aminotransferase